MARDTFASKSLGTLHGAIKESRVLMVGAGGIGCELLKNLVLTGFGEIHIVDLDTIDLSNLNRQFLFRNEHIKKSKALVAKDSALKFNPNVKIEAYHDNIKDSQFNVAWFKTFNIVFNALDNLDARRHVNKMCLAANVPLIESGTTGFNGQVQVIKKGETECYDCTPKIPPKSFPVCTIRSTPSQPIHCIVWGKSYLFAEIFGASEDEAPELDHSEDSDNAKEVANLQKEAQALKRIREAMGSGDFPRLLFNKVFKEDVERLRSMEGMWKTKRAPEALDYDALLQESLGCDPAVAQKDQVTWSTAENFAVFVDSLRRLSTRLEELRARADVGDAAPILTFDKDDEDTLDFVAAAANLRSHIFGIETRSKFDIKQMAGNIIPAIATTNAMTAGLCVLQAFKVMRGQLNKAKFSFLTRTTERVLASDRLLPPNPNCATCGVAYATLVVDTKRAKLSNLVETLTAQLGYGEDFSIKRDADLLYDVDEDVHLEKSFEELSLKADTFITVFDEADEDAKVDVLFSVIEKEVEEGETPLSLPEQLVIAKKPKKPEPETNGHAKIDATMHNGTNGTTKRKADEAGLKDEMTRKKGKVVEEAVTQANEVVYIIEDDGTIDID
ncbi:ubiquitin-activating enzyme E1-like [Parastagonospora nodorum]|nr:ubiquitin-activating enzyme E1-like [Parastagonospora nodorum]KAH4281207.1 ubiquitin-activating enzyme E1-like [Parastagonospora nodorum]KAH4341295.1 ubiquitin-activating enzyme E1-like [Parastagonospora nodorum]KAH4369352.1 ubiquitin-activating enzyme E1-like [Parastagonospora nodorum]KAH4387128.1 ubiquitin-activating enzyme E1-like [Parastagonospora nodorum]